MRILFVVLVIYLSGCTSFTTRPPVIEDSVKASLFGERTVGTLATTPDYRVMYVKLNKEAKLCVEAPADAAAQFSQSVAGSLSTGTELSAEATASLAVAIKQLFKRSQGVQFFRDGSFTLCNLYLNDVITEPEKYLKAILQLQEDAKELIMKEIPHLEKITIDPIGVPTAPTPPAGSSPAPTPPS